jgi:hypothetical protein
VGASNDEGQKFLVGMVTDCNIKAYLSQILTDLYDLRFP